MELEVTTFVNGRWRENCYIVANADGDALIIDPGSEAQEIIGITESHGWRVHAILNSHGHYDHVGAVAELQERFGAPFYLHQADADLLRHANLYRMLFGSAKPVRIPEINQDISTLPQQFTVGPFAISWIETPGHTNGSVCFSLGSYLFSGDTLLREAVGRTDLPGGDRRLLAESLRKLQQLPPEMVVCGGHGKRTTLEAEFSPGKPAWAQLQ